MTFHPTAVCALLLLSGCASSAQTAHRSGATGEIQDRSGAITRGAELVQLVESAANSRAQSAADSYAHRVANANRAVEYIGKSAAFEGSYGHTRWPGDSSDTLVVTNDVSLQILIVPYKELRPHAAVWTASVVGIIRAVDLEAKMITIEVMPNDYVVSETFGEPPQHFPDGSGTEATETTRLNDR